MRTGLVALALGLALAPWTSWAQTDGYTLDDYQLHTSGDLLDICTVDPANAQYWEARAFCLGYFTGGIHLHDELVASGDFPRIACAPPNATRDDVVAAFVSYAQAHPQYLKEQPMDTVFRAVNAKWPCP
jgi:Rap1a immunity proteins